MKWQKSTKSNASGACVEVASEDDMYYVRDSKDKAGPTLCFTRTEWLTFVEAVKAGEFGDR